MLLDLPNTHKNGVYSHDFCVAGHPYELCVFTVSPLVIESQCRARRKRRAGKVLLSFDLRSRSLGFRTSVLRGFPVSGCGVWGGMASNLLPAGSECMQEVLHIGSSQN